MSYEDSEIVRFFISPLGEYGHDGKEGTLSLGGCVNVSEALTKWSGFSEEAALKREFDAQLHSIVRDSREYTLYRLWENVSTLDSGFLFFGNVPWKDGSPVPGGAALFMSVEYTLDEKERIEIVPLLESLGLPFSISEMWQDSDDPSRTQYEIAWSVLGMSFAEIAAIQIRWLDIATPWVERKVSVR